MADMAVSATQDEFATILNRVVDGKERIVLHRDGKPVAVVIPVEDLKLLERLIEEEEDRIDLANGLRSARVYVNGHAGRLIRGRRLRSAIDLRGLPHGRFQVTVVAVLRNGRHVSASRTYHTCEPKRPRSPTHRRPRIHHKTPQQVP